MSDDPDPELPRADRRTNAPPTVDSRFPVPLHGVEVDPQTRCTHWNETVDVVALRFGCCAAYSPCFACHEAVTDHEATPWPRERFDEPAVLCGVCGVTLRAEASLDCADVCPECGVSFTPGCRRHRDRYFEPR